MRIVSWVALGGLALSSVAGCDGAASEPAEVRVVAKLDPHPWFDRLEEGVTAAGVELDIGATMVGPVDAVAADQITLIEAAIADGVDVIGVIPNDAAALEPVLQEARAAGIVVLTHESPDQVSADWDIETIDNQRFAEVAMEQLGDLIGGTGQVGHFVGGADLHQYWNTTARTYAQNTWGSDVEFVSIEVDGTSPTPCAESATDCATATEALLVQYPNLAGILAFGSQGAIGAGNHLMGANRTNVAVVGVTVPSQAADLMEAGWIDAGVLWDPRDAGYALVSIGNLIAAGDEPVDGLVVTGLGAATVNRDVRDIYFDRVLEVTAANVRTFPF